jgi:small subunit ribosomal protein S12
MALLTQLKRQSRSYRIKRTKVRALWNCPQKRGICYFFEIMAPRKPNSAKRKVVRVRLSTKKRIFGYIPGTGGHTLQKYSHVLLQGNIIQDLPNVHYSIIRGILDLKGLFNIRWQSRSKYGTRDLTRVPRRIKRDLLSKYRLKLKTRGLFFLKKEKQLAYVKTFFLRTLLVKGKSYFSKMNLKFFNVKLFSLNISFNFLYSFLALKLKIRLYSIIFFKKWFSLNKLSIFLGNLFNLSFKKKILLKKKKFQLFYYRNVLYFFFRRRLLFLVYFLLMKISFKKGKFNLNNYYCIPSLFFYRQRYQNFLIKFFFKNLLQKPFLKAQLRSLLTIYCYGRGYLNFRVPALTINNNKKIILRPSLRLRVLKKKRFKISY